jgi:hypothetical protein
LHAEHDGTEFILEGNGVGQIEPVDLRTELTEGTRCTYCATTDSANVVATWGGR